jgi:hypothetical protein
MRTNKLKTMTAEECGNQHGYLCPTCKKGDQLTISAVRAIDARLYPDGTDDDGGDTEWDDTSCARCGCGWEGKVKDLKTVEIEDEPEPEPLELGGAQPDVYNEH